MKPLFDKCCFCLDTSTGVIITGAACLFTSLLTYITIILSFINWDVVTDKFLGLFDKSFEFPDWLLDAIWWGSLVVLNLSVVYIILCNFLISASLRNKFKLMLPWIVFTGIAITICIIILTAQLLLCILGGNVFIFIIPPGITGFIWCLAWFYGFLCVVSSYMSLSGKTFIKEEIDWEATIY